MRSEKSIARLLAGGVVAAGVLMATVPAQAVAPARAEACPATAVFQADGYNSGESLVNWNNSRFNHNVPAGVQIVQVPYFAGVFPVVDRLALDASVAEGVGKLTAAVNNFHATCPGSHLTLSGYSEGAAVAGNVLERLAKSTAIPREQINGVLYGNPRRPFGDGGRGGVAGGIETNLPSILPGVTMQGPHDYAGIAVREVCNENDGICNSTNMITNLAAFANGLDGYLSGDHGYDLDPIRDTGNGVTLNSQQPRIPYGAPLPLPVGTPWQIQQQLFGDGPARQAAVTARNGLGGLLSPEALALLNNKPWFRLLAAV
jgi:hypothetical protein